MASLGGMSSPHTSDSEPISEYEDLKPALFEVLDRICRGDCFEEEEENAEIVKILKAWLSLSEKDSEARHAFIYSLAEEEMEGPLSLGKLEGRAGAVTKRIMDLGVRVPGFDLFLAILEKETIGERSDDYEDEYNFRRREYYDDDEDEDGEGEDYDTEPEMPPSPEMGEIQEVHYHLDKIYDLVSGKSLGDSKYLDEDQILQDLDDYFEEEPDEKCDEDMAYCSQPITYYHRRPALVIVPEQATLKFLSSTSPSELLPWYTNICLSRATRPSYLAAFNKLCRSMVRPSRGHAIDEYWSRGNLLAKMVQVALLHRQDDTLDCILKNNNDPLPLGFFTALATHVDPKEMPWSKLQERMRTSFKGMRALSQHYEILEELDTLGDASDDLEACIAGAVDDLLSSLNSLEHMNDVSERSGEIIYQVALQFKGFQYIKTKFVTTLKAYTNRTAFMLGFMRMLRRSMNRHEAPRDAALKIYKTLAGWTIESMDGSIVTARPPASTSNLPSGSAQRPPPSKKRVERVKPETFGAFIDSWYEYKFEELPTQLFELLIRDKNVIPASEYNPLYIPLLQGLLVSIEKHKAPLLQPAHQAVFQTLLWSYIQSYVGVEPLANKWARSPLKGCQCRDCPPMNEFLKDGTREVGYFRLAESRRRHLLQQLELNKLDFTSQVDRTNTPFTLVITKVDKLTEQWTERRLTAENNISAFDQEKLMGLLQNWYVDITTMRMLAQVGRRQQRANYGGSVYSRSLGYLDDPSPFRGGISRPRASPAVPASAAPTFSPAQATDGLPRNDIRNHFMSTNSPKRTEAQGPKLYSVFTQQSSSRRVREPLAQRSENADEKLARLQKMVSKGGSQSSSSYKAPSAARSSAGVKRKATDVIDLTLDSD
ncbi:hypothetical protein BJ166DRAFT_626962 [Pestalotiopsis sp. NC0098]|nr:hypothetical protein BJ166DRAFT_626962 [Pestalotiopsis sp. NC0098]